MPQRRFRNEDGFSRWASAAAEAAGSRLAVARLKGMP